MEVEQVSVVKVVPEVLKVGYDEIKKLTLEESRQRWVVCTGKAVEMYRQKAQLVFHFEQEGWDTSELDSYEHAYYYREIAYGRVLPEVLEKVKDPSLLERVCLLPIPDQLRVVNSEKVPVLLSFNEQGHPYFQDMDLLSLTPCHARVVLHKTGIYDEAKQIAYMRTRTNRLLIKRNKGKLVPDKRKQGATAKVGNVSIFFSRAEIEACLTALR